MTRRHRARRRHGRLRLHGRRPLPGAGAPPAASSTCRCAPDAARLRPRRGPGGRGGRHGSAGSRRDRLAASWSTARRHRPGRHLHARVTPTPRSRSPRSRPASTCCARSRSPTRSPRPRRWPRRPSAAAEHGVRSDGRLHLPPGAGDRARPPAGRSEGGSARSGTCGRSTCRTGSSTRSSRWSGGCEKEQAGSGALGDIGAHIVDLTQYITGEPIIGVTALIETFVQERPLAAGPSGGLLGGGSTARAERWARSPSTTRRCSWPARRRGGGDLRGHPVRHRPQERASGSRSTASTGSLAFDFEDMNELEFYDARRGRARPPASAASWSPSPSTRTSALVAARARPRLRARLHPPGGRPGDRDRRGTTARAVVRRRSPGPAGPRRRRAQRGAGSLTSDRADTRRHALTPHRKEPHDDTTDHPVHRPVGRPAVRGGVPARLRWGYDGLEIACWGDHLDVWQAVEDDAYLAAKQELLDEVRPEGLGDLQPPRRPGRLRRPDRRAPPRHPARPDLGRRRRRRASGSGPPRR